MTEKDDGVVVDSLLDSLKGKNRSSKDVGDDKIKKKGSFFASSSNDKINPSILDNILSSKSINQGNTGINTMKEKIRHTIAITSNNATDVDSKLLELNVKPIEVKRLDHIMSKYDVIIKSNKNLYVANEEDGEIKGKKEYKKGENSKIYKANYKSFTVAIKVFSHDFKTRRELSIPSVFHPNISKLYCISIEKPFIGLVQEFCENGNLREYSKLNKLNWHDKLRVLKEVCEGLSYLHNRNLTFMNLQTNKIFVTRGFKVKLSLYGINRIYKDNRNEKTDYYYRPSKNSNVFTAPEIVFASSSYTKSVDIFSLSMIMYELLVGKVPFHDIEGAELTMAVDVAFRPNIDLDSYEDELWYIELMVKSWDRDINERPTVDELKKIFSVKVKDVLMNKFVNTVGEKLGEEEEDDDDEYSEGEYESEGEYDEYYGESGESEGEESDDEENVRVTKKLTSALKKHKRKTMFFSKNRKYGKRKKSKEISSKLLQKKIQKKPPVKKKNMMNVSKDVQQKSVVGNNVKKLPAKLPPAQKKQERIKIQVKKDNRQNGRIIVKSQQKKKKKPLPAPPGGTQQKSKGKTENISEDEKKKKMMESILLAAKKKKNNVRPQRPKTKPPKNNS